MIRVVSKGLAVSLIFNTLLLGVVAYLALYDPVVASVSTQAGVSRVVRANQVNRQLAERHGEEIVGDLVGRALIDLAAAESSLQLDEEEFQARWQLWLQEPGVRARINSGETTEGEFKARLETLVLLDQLTENKFNPGELEETIRNFYDARQPELEEVHLRHILLENEKDAADVASRLDAGVEFGSLAQRFSLDPLTREEGGDLGWKTRADLTEDLRHIVFILPVGVVSRPLNSRHGWHLFLVEARRSTFEECRPKARREWAIGRRPDTLDELRREFVVEKESGDSLLTKLRRRGFFRSPGRPRIPSPEPSQP